MAQLLYIVGSLHILLCPFTKVEESFNIQAFHDILYHQHNLSQYDHNDFPGVVPRTFIGPIVISFLSTPVAVLFHIFGINKFWMQYVVRLTLALTVITAWNRLKNALCKQFGSTFAWWFTIITVTQYHFMFYMSRPLPNVMVLPLVLLAFEGWLLNKLKQFVISAGAAIILFRSELAMLFGLFLIIDIYFKKVEIASLLKLIIQVGICLMALTVLVDSIFWGRLVWPEAEVFWFNTVLNKSSDWGTSPFLWYFYSALPRGLGPSLLLIPVGLYLDKRMITVAAPAFVFILLFSFLPHKELRFIIYVYPLLNMVSAAACSYIYVRRTKAPIYELLFWGTIVIIVGNVILSMTFVSVAMTNYPGGVAITRFHKLLKNEPFVHLHISNLAAQTGVTRFTQMNDNWLYSKNESLQPEQLQKFTHLLVEAKSKYSPTLKAFMNTHVILDSVDAFSQVAMNYKLIPPIRIKTKPALFILERKDFRDYPHGHSIQIENLVQEDIDSSQLSTEDISHVEIKPSESPNVSPIIEDNIINEKEKDITRNIKEPIINLDETKSNNENEDMPKPKKIFQDLKILRQERKKKAIAKIKSETRNEVVASAKEKLKDILKRHKHIADELSETYIPEVHEDMEDQAAVSDIDLAVENHVQYTEESTATKQLTDNENVSDVLESINLINRTNENINVIVEEVITRLIERKVYDDKTKPEDIKSEDRHIIQQIVEEVLSEKTNYSNIDA